MSVAAVRRVVSRLAPDRPPTDAELVLAIAPACAQREAAFAELVDRYGSMVLGVCRRVLSDAHDAEDAFQAAFLVLARRAATIRPPGAVGGWLYGVAVRTARKAKTAAARRRRREMAATVSAHPDREVGSELQRAELRAAIDDELAALPESQRAAVVLCDLHGKTRAEAAAELERPEGTVAAWLARGRKTLATRLARRGVALPAAGLVAVATPAAVSAELRSSAFAALFGRGVSPAALALAESVVQGLASGTKLAAALVAVGALVAAVATAGAWPSGNDPKPDAPPIPVRAPAPEEPKPKMTPNAWKEQKALALPGWMGGSVTFSPDGKALYVGGTGGFVHAYEAATMKKLWESQVQWDFAAVAPSPNGPTLAVTTHNGVRFLDAATGKLGESLEEADSKPFAVGWFPDKPVLDPNTGQQLATSRKVIFGSGSGYVVKVWLEKSKLERGEPSTITASTTGTGKKPADEYAIPLAVSPDGKWVVSRGPIDRDTGKNVLWAWASGSDAQTKSLDGHKAEVVSAAWSSDGKLIVTGDADGTAILWNAETFKEKSRLKLGGRVAGLALSADGKSAAAAVALNGPNGYSEATFVWETATAPEKPAPLATQAIGGAFRGFASVAFSPDGKTLVSTFANFDHLRLTGILIGRVRVFTLAAPPAPKPAPKAAPGRQWTDAAVLEDHGGLVNAVAVAPNGRWFIATSDNGKIVLWEVPSAKPEGFAATRKALAEVNRATKGAYGVSFAADGKTVAVGSDMGVLGYHPPSLKEAAWSENHVKFGAARAVALSPDGTRYAASDGYVTRVRRLDGQGEEVSLGKPPKGDAAIIPAGVAWSEDGKQLAVIRHDAVKSSVALWEPGEGDPKTHLVGHTGRVTCVAWSADGKLIASGDEKGIVIAWDAATGKELWRRAFRGRDDTDGRINALAISPADSTVAVAVSLGSGKGPERVALLDGKSGADIEHLMRGRFAFTSVAWEKEGKYLVTGSGVLPGEVVKQTEPAVGEVVVWERKP